MVKTKPNKKVVPKDPESLRPDESETLALFEKIDTLKLNLTQKDYEYIIERYEQLIKENKNETKTIIIEYIKEELLDYKTNYCYIFIEWFIIGALITATISAPFLAVFLAGGTERLLVQAVPLTWKKPV